MALAHISLGKVVGWAAYFGVAVFVALKESVQVAVIMVLGGVVIALINLGGTAMFRRWDRKDRIRDHAELMEGQKVIQGSVDGAAAILRQKYDAKVDELATASTRADRSEAGAEATELERNRDKP
jgi:hypothetical protein